MIELKENAVILFQGDSITDATRIRMLSESMGNGYCHMLSKVLHKKYARLNITCINRGIYGDTTGKLLRRWERDTLAAKPDVLSLLIGVNDTWRRYDRKLITTPEKFRENYDCMLKSVVEAKPDTQIVLMSPFLTPMSWQESWTEDLLPKIAIVEELAKKYGATYIPLHNIFSDRLKRKMPFLRLTLDGVHPNLRGNRQIKKSWLEYTGL